jgi:hypothetical protein
MDIAIPLQFESLIAFIVFTVAIVGVLVYCMSRSKSFRDPDPAPKRLNLVVGLLLTFGVASVMAFLLVNALAYGEAYCFGRQCSGTAYSASEEPFSFWSSVVFSYILGVAAVSYGLLVGAKLIQSHHRP